MQATIKYRLSESGQKAALLAKKGGNAERTEVVEVPDDAIDLFKVNSAGELTADLTEGSARNVGGWGWTSVWFDRILTASDTIAFLRDRLKNRAAVEVAEAAEKAAKDAEKAAADKARRVADIEVIRTAAESDEIPETMQREGQTIRVGVKRDGYFGLQNLNAYSADDPECGPDVQRIIDIMQAKQDRINAEKATEEARTALRARIPGAPVIHSATINPDGKIAATIPASPKGDGWAKHVTSVNTTQRNGMAFEGQWMDQGSTYNLDAGDLVVIGAKWYEGSRRNGEYKKSRALYIVTPAGCMTLSDNSPEAAAEALKQTPQERVIGALTRKLGVCDDYIARLTACQTPEFAELADMVTERIYSWTALKGNVEAALAAAAAEPAITTIEAAAAAIVSMGYRELSKRHHPDAGGTTDEMALINQARTALTELLKLAQGEGVTA
jgi:hypothetical protein